MHNFNIRNNSNKEVILNGNLKVILRNHKKLLSRHFKIHSTVKQIKESNRLNRISHSINSYLYNSSLHGLNYVGDIKISYGERLCWLISFLIALGFAIYFIVNIYIKYTSNPMLISVNPKPIPMEDIPFPAITLCNLNLARKNESLLILKNGSMTEKSILENICRIDDEFSNVEEFNDTNRLEEIKKIILKISQPCNKMLHTYEGLCCTFNMLPINNILRSSERTDFDPSLEDYSHLTVDDWNPERGYAPDTSDDSYPYRSQENNETRICHQVNDPCSVSVKESMDQIESETDDGELCDCLPSCYQLEYEKSISYGQLANKSRSPDEYLYDKTMDYIKHNIIIADVYFEITEFSRFTKNELYGTLDIMAGVGGLLGLFLGFSMLSIVELVYYFTLKLFCNFLRARNKEKAIIKKVIPVLPLEKLVKVKN
ncbi:hypothetical protein RN001_007767 [Aquatica leii]|uniref:Uncharacterized protein n=1 Tax=Aquatica leii TaxID=1421715 RepID=A0AAN7PDL5_9COLE|nr:hypothetical protein RN001_007767 [Aquatica leii]